MLMSDYVGNSAGSFKGVNMEIQVVGVGFDKPIILKAVCGHEDALGYFANTVCSACAKANHKKALRGI